MPESANVSRRLDREVAAAPSGSAVFSWRSAKGVAAWTDGSNFDATAGGFSNAAKTSRNALEIDDETTDSATTLGATTTGTAEANESGGTEAAVQAGTGARDATKEAAVGTASGRDAAFVANTFSGNASAAADFAPC
jgi:hypothetical protein